VNVGQYLEITDLGIPAPHLKTKLLKVSNRRTGATLGFIRWFREWRQYVFCPEPTTVFNPECMMLISKRCESETSVQREKARKMRELRV
jgi:hypothetical protein